MIKIIKNFIKEITPKIVDFWKSPKTSGFTCLFLMIPIGIVLVKYGASFLAYCIVKYILRMDMSWFDKGVETIC